MSLGNIAGQQTMMELMSRSDAKEPNSGQINIKIGKEAVVASQKCPWETFKPNQIRQIGSPLQQLTYL
jgi:hypothetical protein